MRDPDAAEQLLAQLHKEEQAAKQRPVDPAEAILRKVYDPITLLANMASFYRWSDREMNELGYVKFFAYAEKADEIQKKRNAAMNNPSSNNDIVSEQEVRGWLPPTRDYEGPTINVR